MRYISECLDLLLSGHGRWMEPRPERLDDWVQRSQAEMRSMVWSQPSIRHSFYKNADGDVYTLSPWRLVDYWTWTRNADPEDYTFG